MNKNKNNNKKKKNEKKKKKKKNKKNKKKSSFSNLSVTSATSQLILQHFRRFTYVTATLPLSSAVSVYADPCTSPVGLYDLQWG